ncbi:EAL and GGDEF domain-containing protein [Microvirga brassicacearum]|uniref:PAS domain S-box protein n=1 Tax=Microvirga brassicacearum TaxID=2580413 RepID=A0A5N3PFP0_9HYPH|nr:PAS domain S-box protein [Microvirga brassicacearum]KAB0268524.1 PAS domain S-box protein [Microvirga brassicacearum]
MTLKIHPGPVQVRSAAEAFERILNGIAQPVIVKDHAHRFVFLNDAACSLVGQPREAMIGRVDHNFIPKEQADSFWAIDDEVLSTGQDHQVEEIITTGDGTIRTLSTHKRLVSLPAATGEDSFIVAVISDITELRQAEVVLCESEEHYRYSVELNPQIPWTADPQGKVVETSSRWQELTGVPVQEALGRGWIKALHPEDLPPTQQSWLNSVASGERFDAEYRLRLQTGIYRWFRARATARRNKDGGIIRWYGTLEDIHESKLATQALRERERQLAIVFGQTMVGILHRGMNNEVLMVNQRFCDIVGRRWEELDGLPMRDFTHPEDFPNNLAVFEEHRERGEPFEIEKRYIRPDGTATWCAVNVSFVRDETGEVISTITVAQDTDKRKRAEEQYRESQENFRYLVELNPQIPWIADPKGRTVEISSRWLSLTGFSRDEVLSEGGWAKGLHPDDLEPATRRWAQSITTGEPYDDEFRLRLADGSFRWFRGRATARRNETDAIVRWYGTAEDIHDSKLAEESLRWAAFHDPLTGLPNRSFFQARLQQALDHAFVAQQRVGLLIVDLDDFKQINDRFGHDAGDAVLKAFAARLQSIAPAPDCVARLGGDEFSIIIPNIDETEVIRLAENIVTQVREPSSGNHIGRDYRASVGGAISSDLSMEPDELLKQADLALYSGKATGPGLFRMYKPSMRDEMQQTASALRLAQQAVRFDWIVPFYQPKIALGDGGVAGFEALLRWHHPRRGLQAPDTIAPAFDDVNLGIAIGERMLSSVLRDLSSWLDAGLDVGSIAINASASEFLRGGYAEWVLNRLRLADLPTSCLELEVTETVFLGRDAKYVEHALRTLSAEGIKIALDDFGTGYASLLHLKKFPVDVLKLDRSFVSNLESGSSDAAIVKAVLSLGQNLDLRVVAEGVETSAQASLLWEQGCDFGQGYFFGRPMAAEAVPRFLRSWPDHGVWRAGPRGKLREA